MIIYLWLTLFAIFAGSYVTFFSYLRSHSRKPWGLEIDPGFAPSISVLVPAHNEEKVILSKLENLKEVAYPKDKMEVIVIDDFSSDQTLSLARSFVESNPTLNVKVLHQETRQGKAKGLNKALNGCSHNLVVVTDADTCWPSDILGKALPYMSDPSIGAISGVMEAKNAAQSWVTNAEGNYMNFMSTWRLGESKIHSTIRFEGCFCVFRRQAFDEFDDKSGADDSGTALRIIQNKYRAILIPEARTKSEVAFTFRDRLRGKVRRAVHLAGLWVQCLSLLARRRLVMPKRIAVPEIILSLFMPFIFVALACLTFVVSIYYPIFFLALVISLAVATSIPIVRNYLVQAIFDQFILFYAVILNAKKKRFITWEK